MRQHAGFPTSLAVRYSDGRLGDDPDHSAAEPQEWAVDRHTEESPTDAYGVVNFQGGSHSYRAKVRGLLGFRAQRVCTGPHGEEAEWYCRQYGLYQP